MMTPKQKAIWLALGLSALGLDDAAGDDLLLNSNTTLDQRESSVAVAPDGSGVVVWVENPNPGQGQDFEVVGRRFDSTGQLLDAQEFQVNEFTTGRQFDPQAAMMANGDFVIVWSGQGSSANPYSIWGRRFTSQGQAQGGDFQVNGETTSRLGYPDISVAPDQSFTVVWSYFVASPGTPNLAGRRFDAEGDPAGSEFVLDDTGQSSEEIRIAHGSSGNFLAVWNGGRSIRLFDPDGQPVSDLFDPGVSGSNVQPGVAASGDSFLVSYGSTLAQRFDAAGNPAGDPLLLGLSSSNRKVSSVAGGPDGFHVVFEGPDGDGLGVVTRWLSADGRFLSGPRTVNRCRPGAQLRPDIGVDALGRATMSWEFIELGIRSDVYAALVEPPFSIEVFADGFESGDTSSWSSGAGRLQGR